MHYVFNTKPLSYRHIAYYTEVYRGPGQPDELILVEVVEATYDNPEANGYAFHKQIETHHIYRAPRGSLEAGAMILMEANQKALYHDHKDKNLKVIHND